MTGAVLIFDQESWDAAKDDAFSNLGKNTGAQSLAGRQRRRDFLCTRRSKAWRKTSASTIGRLATTLNDYNRAVESGTMSFSTCAANRQAEAAAGAVLRLESRSRHHLHHGRSLSERPRSSAE